VTDDPDRETVLRLMREAIQTSRGYAGFWEWPDRSIAEVGAADVVMKFMRAADPTIDGVLASNPEDPPDVILTTADGRRIGIEVTELVDEEAVQRSRHRLHRGQELVYDWAEWDVLRLSQSVLHLVGRKDRKLREARGFDMMIVAIITDEPMIDVALARSALELCCPVVSSIGRAFLTLSYSPDADKAVYPEGYPVLPIALVPADR
jgi:hypothetical protein